jgi:hypothetical protein
MGIDAPATKRAMSGWAPATIHRPNTFAVSMFADSTLTTRRARVFPASGGKSEENVERVLNAFQKIATKKLRPKHRSLALVL